MGPAVHHWVLDGAMVESLGEVFSYLMGTPAGHHVVRARDNQSSVPDRPPCRPCMVAEPAYLGQYDEY